MAERFRDRPFAILSINAEPQKDLKEVKEAWTAEGNTWRCVLDSEWEGPIQKVWNIQRFPTIYVLDGQGLIRYKDVLGRDLEAGIDALLKELPQPTTGR